MPFSASIVGLLRADRRDGEEGALLAFDDARLPGQAYTAIAVLERTEEKVPAFFTTTQEMQRRGFLQVVER
jgi:hypothetical protein